MTIILQKLGLGCFCHGVDDVEDRTQWVPLFGARDQIQRALDPLQEANPAELVQRPINFIEIEEQCGHAAQTLQQFSGRQAPNLSHEQQDLLRTLQEHLDQAHHILAAEPVKSVLLMQKKATAAGFPELYHDPRALRFACESRLIYTMQTFRNAGDALYQNDIGIRLTGFGAICFKVNGKFISYDDIISLGIAYDHESGKFPGWNFIHPDGFVRKDSYDYDELYPVARLSERALTELQEHAMGFRATPTVAAAGTGERKDYILQLVTSEDRHFQANPLLRNLGDWFPMHASLRVITPDGYVYSCGSRIRKEEENFCLANYFSTKMTKMPIPDYTETHPYEERRVTSIPISKTGSDAILGLLRRVNQGVPFCFPRQNCTRIVTTAASYVGLDINTRLSLQEGLWNCVPNIGDIPVIGPVITRVATAIDRVVGPTFRRLSEAYTAIVPLWMRNVIAFPMYAITAAIQKIATVIINLGTITVGSMQALPPDDTELRQVQMGNVRGIPGLEWFDQLVHWRDIFRDDAVPLYHAKLLKDWQNEQATTVTYRKEQSELCVIPSQARP